MKNTECGIDAKISAPNCGFACLCAGATAAFSATTAAAFDMMGARGRYKWAAA